jgi:hypothetical protein
MDNEKNRTGQTSTPRQTSAPSERPCTEKTGEEETVVINYNPLLLCLLLRHSLIFRSHTLSGIFCFLFINPFAINHTL